MLKANELEFSYDEEPTIRGVSFDLDYGNILGVVGPNGSGKTTLIKYLNGLVNPDGGEITIEGRNLTDLSRREIARSVGYVPQSESPTFPSTVFDAVLTGRAPHSNWKPSDGDLLAVSETLTDMGLADLATRDVRELSGGQLRKVLIARAFAQEPNLLLLDEPMASLDLRHQLEVLNSVEGWLTEERAALITFHDLNLAGKYCDKLLVMKNGKIFARGGPEVLASETIEPVYGVEVEINENPRSRWIEPTKPLT
ncbi:ABC transporter ATP-binding protein [Candidatus Bipolaricaulota bacterium]|nr:ABC transporter ATP-binding protein [Candidatus Bipolaricaulota bacterium]